MREAFLDGITRYLPRNGYQQPAKNLKISPTPFSGQCSIIIDPAPQIPSNYRTNITFYTKRNALYALILASKDNLQEIVKYCSRGPPSSFLDMQRGRFRFIRRIPFKPPHQTPPMVQIKRLIWLDPDLGLK